MLRRSSLFIAKKRKPLSGYIMLRRSSLFIATTKTNHEYPEGVFHLNGLLHPLL
jgi:hypothetical protein